MSWTQSATHVLPLLNSSTPQLLDSNTLLPFQSPARYDRGPSKPDEQPMTRSPQIIAICLAVLGEWSVALAQGEPQQFQAIRSVLKENCWDCHSGAEPKAGLDLSKLRTDLRERSVRQRWVSVHDRIAKREMPPSAEALDRAERQALVQSLAAILHDADASEVRSDGRGPMRRLNRDEYQQNLRDILDLPDLDIRDILPEDTEGHLFNKTTAKLNISRVQLTAYLDAADKALRHAIASGVEPPKRMSFRAVGKRLFGAPSTFGEREAMFFARDSKAISSEEVDASPEDSKIEVAIFRSAHWPYHGYPPDFIAKRAGRYRVRFSARAVLQLPGYTLKPATRPVPMTFRARKRSGADVSGDVRATGGLIDVQPTTQSFETTVQLLETETIEYSLLGLPVPLARNVDNGPPTYRYPPFPKGGQPGVAVQRLEIEGPLSGPIWPPASHRVLFDELEIRAAEGNSSGLRVDVVSDRPRADARRLLRRFVDRAARHPIQDEDLMPYERLILAQMEEGESFAVAMLAGYKAFLCSSHMIYLREPLEIASDAENLDRATAQFAIASRLSHFLTNTRPDKELMKRAEKGELLNPNVLRGETNRLIASEGFDRFVRNFTDYWLAVRHLHRDEPNFRVYPEYRFDAYLIESMAGETRAFFSSMVRDNLPTSVLVNADFAFVNDRLAAHYELPNSDEITGSAMRRVQLPKGSPYGGLLAQASVLKVTSNGTATSPVLRGAWVMERLFGDPPPPPPASVPAVEPDIRGAKTIRELLAKHASAKECSSCHARFDPVGVALENFDILGRWRTRYRGLGDGDKVEGIDRAGHDFAYALTSKVDASGMLRDGRKFKDIHELKALLLENPRQLAKNMLTQFIVYATGTPVRFSDRREIEAILDACAGNGYRTADLLHGLVQNKIFLGSRTREPPK